MIGLDGRELRSRVLRSRVLRSRVLRSRVLRSRVLRSRVLRSRVLEMVNGRRSAAVVHAPRTVAVDAPRVLPRDGV